MNVVWSPTITALMRTKTTEDDESNRAEGWGSHLWREVDKEGDLVYRLLCKPSHLV